MTTVRHFVPRCLLTVAPPLYRIDTGEAMRQQEAVMAAIRLSDAEHVLSRGMERSVTAAVQRHGVGFHEPFYHRDCFNAATLCTNKICKSTLAQGVIV